MDCVGSGTKEEETTCYIVKQSDHISSTMY
jgi:hypothetical protein